MDVDVYSAGLETPVWPLLKTVFASILEVFLLCVAGYVLAGQGILDKKTQKQLNKLNVSLFTPCLLFSKVAFFLSPSKLKELWIIPIFFVIVTAVSMSIAFVLGWAFRLKRSQRSFAMAAAMFMNSNSLPVALMQSLVVTVPGLKWGTHDNKDAKVGRALTYLVLYSTLGMVLRWSYGVRLLASADDEPVIPSPPSEADADEHSPLLCSYDNDDAGIQTGVSRDPNFIEPSLNVLSQDQAPLRNTHLRPPMPPRRRTTFYKSFPNSPNESQTDLPPVHSVAESTVSSDSEYDEYDVENAITQRHSSVSRSPVALLLRHTRRRLVRGWMAFNDFMTVPLWAAIASLIVATYQPLQHLLEVHMQPVKHALTSAGNCSIPLTLIILGAYFYPQPNDASQKKTRVETRNGIETRPSTATLVNVSSSGSLMDGVRDLLGQGKLPRGGPRGHLSALQRSGETKTVVISVVARMILTPLVLLPLMAVGSKFDVQKVFDDPVFVVANVLLISSPPALTLAQITQAASGDAFERLISRTIFWSYCIVTPPATIFYVVVGLILARL